MTGPSNDDLEKQVSLETNGENNGKNTLSRLGVDHEGTEEQTSQPTGSKEDVVTEARRPSNPSMQFQTPEYQPADKRQLSPTAGDTALSRTFTNRADDPPQEEAHPFGGDLQRQFTNTKLERFQSQADNKVVMVHWESVDDQENPQNWSTWYKWYLTALAGILVLNSTFTSSSPSGTIVSQERYFKISSEVATLTIAMFVAGYCLGPLLWGPMSEILGRRPTFLVALTTYTGFNVGCALSKNTGSILVFRFLSGTFAAAPLTTSGGVIADIWDARTRGIAMSIFSVAPFAGPAFGPIVGGFIEQAHANWRWLYWTCTIFSGTCTIVTFFTLRETYAPKIMLRKARRIRKETGDSRYKAPLELAKMPLNELLKATLLKPFIMLVEEPMLLAITVYMSFVYGVVYLLFEAFPIVFQGIYGFPPGTGSLMFIPFFLGGVTGVLIYIFAVNPIYIRKVDASPDGRVPPEERMTIVMVAACTLVISFFWFAWTCYRSISFWCPMMAGSLIGFSVLFIFLGLFNYLVDAYLQNAASALAANTVCRSAAGAGFPLFASQMYQKLRPHWASSLLGFIALVMIPIPFFLYRFGPKIRTMSKHAAA